MKAKLFIILGYLIIIPLACEKLENKEVDPFKRSYFYYTFDFEKIPLYLNGSEIHITFYDSLTKDEALDILNKYSYFTDSIASEVNAKTDKLRLSIDYSDTLQLGKILYELNHNPDIYYATPIFGFSTNKSDSWVIPINEIVCDPYISDYELRKLISPFNLSILMSQPESLFYLLKINDLNDGFEPIDIANSLYETKKFHYCHPDFYSTFVPYIKSEFGSIFNR